MNITFNCDKCGQHIVIDEAGGGQLVDCPKCGTKIAVPDKSKQAKIAMTCKWCHKDIMVDASLAGHLTHCPLCDDFIMPPEPTTLNKPSARPVQATSPYKKCPFCAEMIHAEAIKCKHCGEFLDSLHRGQSTSSPLPVTRMQPPTRQTNAVRSILATASVVTPQSHKRKTAGGAIGRFFGVVVIGIVGTILLVPLLIKIADSDVGKSSLSDVPAASIPEGVKTNLAILASEGLITRIDGDKVYVSALWYGLDLQQKQKVGASIRYGNSTGHITILDDHSGRTLAKTSSSSVDIVGAD